MCLVDFAGQVADQYKFHDRPQDVGHFFLAIRADLFIPTDDYRNLMDTLMRRVCKCQKAGGFSEIQIPGEPETRYEAERRRTGIPYSAGEIAVLQEEAKRAGTGALAVSGKALDP